MRPRAHPLSWPDRRPGDIQDTDAEQGGKLSATFVSMGAVEAAQVTVAEEGHRIPLDITTPAAEHHLLFDVPDARPDHARCGRACPRAPGGDERWLADWGATDLAGRRPQHLTCRSPPSGAPIAPAPDPNRRHRFHRGQFRNRQSGRAPRCCARSTVGLHRPILRIKPSSVASSAPGPTARKKERLPEKLSRRVNKSGVQTSEPGANSNVIAQTSPVES